MLCLIVGQRAFYYHEVALESDLSPCSQTNDISKLGIHIFKLNINSTLSKR